jgi:predicted nucleotidyltransferase
VTRRKARRPLAPESADYARELTERLRAALGETLVGVYLHGSAVLGDFVSGRSDIDVVAVSSRPLTDGETGELSERLGDLSLSRPTGGLELHVVDRGTLDELCEPPPFELHVTTTASSEPAQVVVGRGHGGDPDLVMHFAVLLEHGVTLVGPPAAQIFPAVPRETLLGAFAGELCWAVEHASPAYQVLNACRAWRFLEEGVLSSKLAGGEWARQRVRDRATIAAAIRNRRAESDVHPDPMRARSFVESVLARLEQRTTPRR